MKSRSYEDTGLQSRKWNEHFGRRLNRLRTNPFTEDALRVVLADGREISRRYNGFHDYPRDAGTTRTMGLIGDGIGIHWPQIDEDVEVKAYWRRDRKCVALVR